MGRLGAPCSSTDDAIQSWPEGSAMQVVVASFIAASGGWLCLNFEAHASRVARMVRFRKGTWQLGSYRSLAAQSSNSESHFSLRDSFVTGRGGIRWGVTATEKNGQKLARSLSSTSGAFDSLHLLSATSS